MKYTAEGVINPREYKASFGWNKEGEPVMTLSFEGDGSKGEVKKCSIININLKELSIEGIRGPYEDFPIYKGSNRKPLFLRSIRYQLNNLPVEGNDKGELITMETIREAPIKDYTIKEIENKLGERIRIIDEE